MGGLCIMQSVPDLLVLFLGSNCDKGKVPKVQLLILHVCGWVCYND